jgi:uncharacterized protein (DUF169 family)
MDTLAEMSNLCRLMEKGEPACITFLEDKGGTDSDKLYCELIRDARYGKEFHIKSQRCRVGNYVLGKSEIIPSDYYFQNGRYIDEKTAETAAASLPRIIWEYGSIKISPLSRTDKPFDICILYVKPESAMKIIQTLAYMTGEKNLIETLGAASVCGDCTAKPLISGVGLSFGCKGSRKHSNYSDSEVPLGLHYNLLGKINRVLGIIPKTRQ